MKAEVLAAVERVGSRERRESEDRRKSTDSTASRRAEKGRAGRARRWEGTVFERKGGREAERKEIRGRGEEGKRVV